METIKKLVILDCEGPISKNDNAFELAQNFIPNGDKLFTNISKYDDVLADFLQKPGYAAGSTLKLILPFLKAYGLTDQMMEEFSEKNIDLLENTPATLRYVQAISEPFIVSTSYEHYIKALCKAVGFPYKNTYCTKVSLDKCPITPQEKDRLREIAQEISQMPLIEIPSYATSLAEISASGQAAIKRLDEIFWTEISNMSIWKFLNNVTTVGGPQKAEAIRDAVNRSGAKLSNVIYFGDSITDVEALKLVSEAGGLAVSFNGNSYAVRSADVAVFSESNFVIAAIADLFCRIGREPALKVILFWCRSALQESGASGALLKQLYTIYPGALPRAQIVTQKNVESLINESNEYRNKVRGIGVGRLG